MVTRPSPRLDVDAVILAGGRGTRLGGAVKPLLEVDGEAIVSRQLAVLRPRVRRVVLSTAAAVAWWDGPQVVDRIAGAGPLGGLDAALATADARWLLVVAGDLPWLAGALLDVLLAHALAGADELDVVVPRARGHLEPLLALYHRRCGAIVSARLAEGQRRVAGVAEHPAARVAFVDEPALRAVDPELRSFRGVNAPADLAAAPIGA